MSTAMPAALAMAEGVRTAGGNLLYKSLLDLMPTPIYVRTADGQILFANRCGSLAAGELPGMHPAAWQVTPQVAPTTHPSRLRANASRVDKEGEVDLPHEHIPASAVGEPLPEPVRDYSVLIQGRAAPIRAVLTMHRIPFWVATPDGTAQRAVVMYVAPVAGDETKRFFPSVRPPHEAKAAAGAFS